jgi:hypothetical protein
MSFCLILNSSDAISSGGNYNLFQFNFINGGFNIEKDAEICLTQATIPYSWPNVSATTYNNASFQYTWKVGTTVTSYTITLPTGYYQTSDILNYLESRMIANGHYLIDSTGNYVFYISLAVNQTYYTCQLLSYPVPTSLPSGYSAPASWPGYSTTSFTPQLVILSNNFGTLIGFSPGSYPATMQTTSYSTLGNILVNASPVNSVIVRCSLVFNNCTNPTDILDSFPISASFGQNINYSPNFEKWVQIRRGKYSSIFISLYDQNLNPLPSIDPNVLITILIRT